MDQLERNAGFIDVLRAAFIGQQSEIWTAMPGTVQEVNDDNTLTIQLTIQMQQQNKDGSKDWITITPLIYVPNIFIMGGGFVLTMPIAKGDECLVIFSMRCIDNWWVSGEVSTQRELRMHDINDGFAIVGPRSQPKAIPNISKNSAQLRTLGGGCYIDLSSNQVKIVAPNGLTINGDVVINGSVKATGDGVFGSTNISVDHHLHTVGAGQTGPPVTGT